MASGFPSSVVASALASRPSVSSVFACFAADTTSGATAARDDDDVVAAFAVAAVVAGVVAVLVDAFNIPRALGFAAPPALDCRRLTLP